MQVRLSKLPTPNTVYAVDFQKLNGGLNIRELDYRLKPNESPSMRNMWWKDGVLQSRDGQAYVADVADVVPDEPAEESEETEETFGDEPVNVGYTCADLPFFGYNFFHINDGIYYLDPAAESPALTLLQDGVPGNRGTFFRYDNALFYKNNGGYYRIDYDDSGETPVFECSDMTVPGETADGKSAYTPVIVINASPVNAAGTTYQPENRISPRKTVWYNAVAGTDTYHLPVTDIDVMFEQDTEVAYDRYLIIEMLNTGTGEWETLDEGTSTTPLDYYWDGANNVVKFTTAPSPGSPAVDNTVRITYSKANADAYDSVMDCTYAISAGNGTNLCAILAGSTKQPNAVFWNANDYLAMNPGYFPMTNYQLCGNASDPVTGFARQYNDLIVLKDRSVGKLIFSVETVDDRDSILFGYERINSKIGCDLPWSIHTVENNVVFCNTRRGVYVVRSSSAAYENNILCISEKINGSEVVDGLLADVRESGSVTVAADDNEHYWLVANGHAYVWDYNDTSFEDPSWYYFTNVHGVAFFMDDSVVLYHLNGVGQVSKFERTFADYAVMEDGELVSGYPIDKLYTMPTQYFGTYERLKDITSLLLEVRSDTNTTVEIEYHTDYEIRKDRTDIRSWSWRWTPWILAQFSPIVQRYAKVVRRAPGCRHIRQFAVSLSNNTIFEDLAIVSAQVYYRFTGKEK